MLHYDCEGIFGKIKHQIDLERFIRSSYMAYLLSHKHLNNYFYRDIISGNMKKSIYMIIKVLLGANTGDWCRQLFPVLAIRKTLNSI